MNTEADKAMHDMMTYGSGFMQNGQHVPLDEIFITPPIELNKEHTDTWEACYFDNLLGDMWLINLFANEYYYHMNGKPEYQTADFSC